VVATLWDVPDQTTTELMRRFHAGLSKGLRTDEALCQAQRELARGPVKTHDGELVDGRHPWAWAGFQLYGDWW
jgi:CHAT domain-containing protein